MELKVALIQKLFHFKWTCKDPPDLFLLLAACEMKVVACGNVSICSFCVESRKNVIVFSSSGPYYLFYKEHSFHQIYLLAIHLFRTNVLDSVKRHLVCVGFYLGVFSSQYLSSHFASKGIGSFVVDSVLKLKAFRLCIFKCFTGMKYEKMHLCVQL